MNTYSPDSLCLALRVFHAFCLLFARQQSWNNALYLGWESESPGKPDYGREGPRRGNRNCFRFHLSPFQKVDSYS
jgi:hypothetical protein